MIARLLQCFACPGNRRGSGFKKCFANNSISGGDLLIGLHSKRSAAVDDGLFERQHLMLANPLGWCEFCFRQHVRLIEVAHGPFRIGDGALHAPTGAAATPARSERFG